MTAHRIEVLDQSFVADADLSAKQFYAAKLSSTGVNLASDPLNDVLLGLLKSKSTSGMAASVGAIGVYPAKLGGTVTFGDTVTCDSNGKIVRARPGDWILGYALESGVSGDEKPILLSPKGHLFDMYMNADDDLSAKQYYALSVHTDAGEADLAGANECVIGIAQTAAAQGAAVRIRTFGVSKFVAGSGGVTVGDLLEAESGGKLVTATGAASHIVGKALETVSADATGTCFIQIGGTIPS